MIFKPEIYRGLVWGLVLGACLTSAGANAWGLSNLNPLLLKEKFHTFDIIPNCDSLQMGFFFPLVGLCPCLSFLSRCHFFYSLLWRLCSFNFQVLFRGTYSVGSGRFVVSMGRGELRILLCHHLESNLSFLYVLYNSFSVILSQQWFISLAVC